MSDLIKQNSSESREADYQVLERIPEYPRSPRHNETAELLPVNQSFSKKSIERSFYSSKKYSGTGGTGGSYNRSKASPSKVLGDYQISMINKAFADF